MAVSRSTHRQTSRHPTRGRPPKGAAKLSRSAIVEAALAEIEAAGLSGFGMRSVARRLGVDAKSLYNHITDKEALLEAVAKHILSTMVLPEPTGELPADIRAFAQAFRQHALSHPQASLLVLTRPTPSIASLVPVEAALALLASAGIEGVAAVHLLRTFLATLIGMVLREVDAAPTFGGSDPDAIARRRRLLEASGLPHVHASAGQLARFDRDEAFDHAVEFLVRATSLREA